MQKVSGVGTGVVVGAAGNAVSRPVDAVKGSGSASVSADQASVSRVGNLIQEALKTPDVRAERVAELQQRIADGSYFISARDVSDKMVEALLS